MKTIFNSHFSKCLYLLNNFLIQIFLRENTREDDTRPCQTDEDAEMQLNIPEKVNNWTLSYSYKLIKDINMYNIHTLFMKTEHLLPN